jgi:hypothetical protein
MWVIQLENEGSAQRIWSTQGTGMIEILDQEINGYRQIYASGGSAGHVSCSISACDGRQYAVLMTGYDTFGADRDPDIDDGCSPDALRHDSNFASRLGTLAEGDYLRSDYLARLERMLSTRAALGRGDVPQGITVWRDAKKIGLTAHDNWHEGCVLIVIEKDSVAPGDCGQRPEVQVETNTEFLYNGATYILVGNASQRIGAIVLGGAYEDDHGQRYIFGSDGHATFPDKKFEFELYLDQVGPPCALYDSFDDVTNHVIYVFKRDAETLMLFAGPAGE